MAFFGQFSNAKLMKKEEVKQINILQYNSNNCPDYGSSYDNVNGHCTLRFFCRNDTCASPDSNGYVDFTESKRNEKINTNLCYVYEDYDYANRVCTSNKPVCFNDSNCITNMCYNSTCVLNKNYRVEECVDNYYYNHWIFSYRSKVNCGLGEHEICSKDSDCASNVCARCEKGRCCVKDDKDISGERKKDILIKSLLLSFLIIGYVIGRLQQKRKTKNLKFSNIDI
ncbi:hypothetical protein BCR32DRAFT_328785 [Anaeromyces robustus]|uniref:Dickkopf N-terminal cysteine-rich domain-containing protein n=1 Tax=Anaeromyces robustus TaxID=1754192 RepID=A0A1Y1WWI0_9FUNG|nr:hypothetical protein BCR32DRAFT_328785 [Anaeromyces robustus]|eukprot:ORX77755.1 hypothetical protein BCR32DRAFT_328785 [Anaeromyces robustus]